MTLPANITVVETLSEYIKAEIADLDITDEWPNHNDELNYPALSITTVGNGEYRSFGNKKLLSQVEDPENPTINTINIYSVGQYDITLQLDLWTGNKERRGEYLEKLMNVLDKQFIDSGKPSGLSLVLKEYHGIIARYDHTGYNYVDGGQSAQRGEWRVKIDILVNFVRAVVKIESKMVEAKLVSEIGTTIDLDETDDNLREEKTIF